MFRKRLVSFLASVMLALSTSPAAAFETAAADLDGPVIEVVTFAEQAAREHGVLASTAKAAQDPTVLVDQEQEGVGRLYVAVDEEEMTLTIGVGFEPAGVDEDVTVGMPTGGDGEPADEAPGDQASAEDVAASQDKAAMDHAKADAAAAVAASRPSTPAFEAGPRTASGTVAGGTGTGRSVRPTQVAPSPDTDTAADIIVDESNGLLRIFGAMLLAGTTTVWGFAKRHDLV